MTTEDLIRTALIDGGYDGLFCAGECACDLHDLFACGSEHSDCEAGYKVYAHADSDDWSIQREKPVSECPVAMTTEATPSLVKKEFFTALPVAMQKSIEWVSGAATDIEMILGMVGDEKQVAIFSVLLDIRKAELLLAKTAERLNNALGCDTCRHLGMGRALYENQESPCCTYHLIFPPHPFMSQGIACRELAEKAKEAA